MPSKRHTAARLSYEEIQASDGKAFATLYAIFADLFPFPDEREPPEAFYQILALNEHVGVQTSVGPWREIVAAIRLWQGGPIIGGHVFGVTTSQSHVTFGCLVSVQAIYTFVDRAFRGYLDIPDTKAYMAAEALAKFRLEVETARIPPLIFSEVNNPVHMTEEEKEKDRTHSGIDPYRRYNLWKSAGLKPLNFHYVQPPLRPGAAPVDYLDLFCSEVPGGIPKDVILAHLRAFMSVSVLKGRPAEEDSVFAQMVSELPADATIGFVPDDDEVQQAIDRGAPVGKKS
jgi:hypothetical protein